MSDEFLYDVALSFAGEDREYVKKVALELSNRKFGERNVRVFYDAYEQHNLWGNDLFQYLSNIYQKQTRFVIIFISEHYATKVWTKHELKNAQARSLFEDSPYILPARFDDSEIPGLSPTVGYIDLRTMTIKDFVDLVLNKLHSQPNLQQTNLAKKSKVVIFFINLIGTTEVYCDGEKVTRIKTEYKNCIAFEVTQGKHAIHITHANPESLGMDRGSSKRTYGDSGIKFLQFSNDEHYYKCGFSSMGFLGIMYWIFNPYPTMELYLNSTDKPVK